MSTVVFWLVIINVFQCHEIVIRNSALDWDNFPSPLLFITVELLSSSSGDNRFLLATLELLRCKNTRNSLAKLS